MNEEKYKVYDLENKTFNFAMDVAVFCKGLKPTEVNKEYIKQAIRSSGLVGINYLEANEADSEAEAVENIKGCKSGAEGTIYWLKLIKEINDKDEELKKAKDLIKEARELKKMFSNILQK